jgi:hypothetical protein
MCWSRPRCRQRPSFGAVGWAARSDVQRTLHRFALSRTVGPAPRARSACGAGYHPGVVLSTYAALTRGSSTGRRPDAPRPWSAQFVISRVRASLRSPWAAGGSDTTLQTPPEFRDEIRRALPARD